MARLYKPSLYFVIVSPISYILDTPKFPNNSSPPVLHALLVLRLHHMASPTHSYIDWYGYSALLEQSKREHDVVRSLSVKIVKNNVSQNASLIII